MSVLRWGVLSTASIAVKEVIPGMHPASRCEVLGIALRDRGRAEAGGGDPPVTPTTEILEFAPADPYGVQAERFAQVVLDGAALPITPDDSVANMRVIERLSRG